MRSKRLWTLRCANRISTFLRSLLDPSRGLAICVGTLRLASRPWARLDPIRCNVRPRAIAVRAYQRPRLHHKPPRMSAIDRVSVLRAADAAARWHVHQRRKGAAEEPYVNHLLEVATEIGPIFESTR